MKRRIALALLVGIFAAASVQAGSGLLDKDTYMEMEGIRSPAISPQGTHIVFSRSWIDQMKDRSASNLWIIDAEGTKVRELTNGSWRDGSPVWSPDGSKIAFLSDRDGTNQIHILWPETGEVAQLTHLNESPSNLAWSPDGKQIAFTLFIRDASNPLPVKLPARPRGAEWAKGAMIVDRLNWRRDGRGNVPEGFTHVFVIDAVLGGTPRMITRGDYDHGNPQWSADGKTIYVSGIRKPDADYLRNDSEIYAIDLKTREITALTDRKGPDRGQTVSPDGKWIAYTGYDDKRYTSHLSSLYVMAADGGSKRTLADDLPNSPGSLTWADDGSGVYFTIAASGSTNLHFAPLSGAVRQVTQGVHTMSGLSISREGLAATVLSDFTDPGHLAVFNLSSPSRIRSLVDVNEDVLSEVKLGEAEELWYTSADGLKIQGWLIKPANFDPSKKYPMVLWIHGGPWSMYSVGFNWSFQNFSAEGYAVLYTNPRGSTGYGQDFVNGIQYAYPGKDYDDLMAGVDAALAKGFIDEDNLFVCGGSGGGVLTAWIVGHTNRFRAAVSMRPVIDWHSFVGITDGASWYDQFRKYPWEDPMEYAVRSPLHYVGNVTTPTMVMTGEADLRTPMPQSEEFYRALKVLKKETLLVRMPDEYHGWRRPSHRLLQQLYLQAWFEKHMIKGNEDKAPVEEGS